MIPDKKAGAFWFAVAGAIIIVVRLAGLRFYPELAIDEGLWTLQAKDYVLFGEPHMNGLRHLYLSPLSFALYTLWFKCLPATCFSVRLLSAILGILTWLLAFKLADRVFGRRAAMISTLLLGFCFTDVVIHRRAYLENGVLFFSTMLILLSLSKHRVSLFGMFAGVAALMLYKANAIYVLPALLVPCALTTREWQASQRRTMVVMLGLLVSLAVFFLLYRLDPGRFRAAYEFELTKTARARAFFRVGRFGLYPDVLVSTVSGLSRRCSELVAMIGLAVPAVLWRPLRRFQGFWSIWLWLAVGCVFLMAQGFQHDQYFAPLAVPAVLIIGGLYQAAADRSLKCRWAILALCVALMSFSLCRMGIGAYRTVRDNHNRGLAMLEWAETHSREGEAILVNADTAAATTRRAYAFHRIFRPYPPERAPSLTEFVEKQRIRAVIDDQWEVRSIGLGEAFFEPLEKIAEVERFSTWTGYLIKAERLKAEKLRYDAGGDRLSAGTGRPR